MNLSRFTGLTRGKTKKQTLILLRGWTSSRSEPWAYYDEFTQLYQYRKMHSRLLRATATSIISLDLTSRKW